MPSNNPVQVVLNSDQFITSKETHAHGITHKDFYFDDDEGFAQHKQKIIGSLQTLKTVLESSALPVCYAKLTMRENAIAKSYRPTSIFSQTKEDQGEIFVGGGDVGEIYLELTPNRITRSSNIIHNRAENTVTKINRKTNKLEASPIRSELGAIENIVEYSSDEKKDFTLEQAIEHFNDTHCATYVVKLFRQLPSNAEFNTLSRDTQRLFTVFIDGLKQIHDGIIIKKANKTDKKSTTIEIIVATPGTEENITYNYDIDVHARILNFLCAYPLVRKIYLPAKICLVASNFMDETTFTLPTPTNGVKYPILGVIDGGVSDIMNSWIAYKYDSDTTTSTAELFHGTFIAGLACFGNSMNSALNCPETDGCLIADINFFNTPQNKTITTDTLDSLELAIQEAKIQTENKIKVFNLSMNVPNSNATNYDELTQRLDQIAKDHNVIIVISAGNIKKPYSYRPEWSHDINTNLQNLEAYTGNDFIEVPATSIRNISVGAVNPIDAECATSIPLAPTNYTKRGPKSKIILKPDLAYVGGRGTSGETGLKSLSPTGKIVSSAGTSFASPLIARILASLSNDIVDGENLARETLIALLVHSAKIPECLSDKAYKNICRDFVGFGIPDSSKEILNNDDHEIRLVFNSVLKDRKRMVFDFTYPACLVNDSGGVMGEMELTLVSTPPIDARFDAERVRINVNAQISQYTPNDDSPDEKPKYVGLLKPFFACEPDLDMREQNLINTGLKWGTTKKYFFKSPRGAGKSSALRLVISYETRENTEFPAEGVPFSAILTIRDPKKEKPVFSQMRQQLDTQGISIANIQNASQIMV